MTVDVSLAVATVVAGMVGVSAIGGAWLLFRNGAALWNKLGEVGPDPKAEAWRAWVAENHLDERIAERYASGGGGLAASSASSGDSHSESWGLSDVLSTGSSSASSAAAESSGGSRDSFSGGGGEFGGGGSESDF